MNDLALLLLLVLLFAAVLTILTVLASPKRTLIADSHELKAGDRITFEARTTSGNYLKATVSVLATDLSAVTFLNAHGQRSTLTHAVLAARQQDGLTIWKESPDVDYA